MTAQSSPTEGAPLERPFSPQAVHLAAVMAQRLRDADTDAPTRVNVIGVIEALVDIAVGLLDLLASPEINLSPSDRNRLAQLQYRAHQLSLGIPQRRATDRPEADDRGGQ